MCEILTLKKNSKNLKFTREAIQDALTANDDGVGYIIFKERKGNKGFDIKEIKHFRLDGNEVYDHEEPEEDEVTQEDLEEARAINISEYYVYFEIIEGTKKVKLESIDSHTAVLSMPLSLKGIEDKPYYQQAELLEEWLLTKNILCDFASAKSYTKEDTKKKTTMTTWDRAKLNKTNAIDAIFERQDELKERELMIIHFRKATSGNSFENTQPILHKNFTVIHNGVFTSLGDKDISDTAEFAKNLQVFYEAMDIKTAKEEEVLLETVIEVTKGWYSMYIHSFKTKRLYYFRKGAMFYTAHSGNMFSTKDSRFPNQTKLVESHVL